MDGDEKKVLAKINAADTDELLDQVTAYRAGMEAFAIEMIERELHTRGVSAAQIAEHRETCERECVYLPDGVAAMCSFCRKPAVKEGQGWHKLMGIVPVVPRWLCYCKAHCKK